MNYELQHILRRKVLIVILLIIEAICFLILIGLLIAIIIDIDNYKLDLYVFILINIVYIYMILYLKNYHLIFKDNQIIKTSALKKNKVYYVNFKECYVVFYEKRGYRYKAVYKSKGKKILTAVMLPNDFYDQMEKLGFNLSVIKY